MYNFKAYRNGFLIEEKELTDREFGENMAMVAAYIQDGWDYTLSFDYTGGDFWYGKKQYHVSFGSSKGYLMDHIYQHID